MIKIKLKRGAPVFKGPAEVPADGVIQVLNKTNPSAIGPHTFSLVTKAQLPNTEREREKCGKNSNRKLICKDIAQAHDMTGLSAGEPVVDTGTVGEWDARFDGEATGDSWFTQTQGESHSRDVGLEDGAKLYYMCIIHPKMQGKITVNSTR